MLINERYKVQFHSKKSKMSSNDDNKSKCHEATKPNCKVDAKSQTSFTHEMLKQKLNVKWIIKMSKLNQDPAKKVQAKSQGPRQTLKCQNLRIQVYIWNCWTKKNQYYLNLHQWSRVRTSWTTRWTRAKSPRKFLTSWRISRRKSRSTIMCNIWMQEERSRISAWQVA